MPIPTRAIANPTKISRWTRNLSLPRLSSRQANKSRNQEQVHDRRIHVGRGRLEGVRQNRQNGGRLDQLLEAVHPAKDSPPYQDANAPAPTDGRDGAGSRSNGQENRSQDDIDHVAAERCQSGICRVHAIHLRGSYSLNRPSAPEL